MGYVILVEDNLDNANMMIRLLESAGHKVRHFVEGSKSVPIIRWEKPDLVLMDFNLPDIDGRTLVLIIKKQMGEDAPPIIAVTARTGVSEEKLAQSFGCDAFLNKPFDPQKFLELVTQFITKPIPKEES